MGYATLPHRFQVLEEKGETFGRLRGGSVFYACQGLSTDSSLGLNDPKESKEPRSHDPLVVGKSVFCVSHRDPACHGQALLAHAGASPKWASPSFRVPPPVSG